MIVDKPIAADGQHIGMRIIIILFYFHFFKFSNKLASASGDKRKSADLGRVEQKGAGAIQYLDIQSTTSLTHWARREGTFWGPTGVGSSIKMDGIWCEACMGKLF